jgi:hypothetical protein
VHAPRQTSSRGAFFVQTVLRFHKVRQLAYRRVSQHFVKGAAGWQAGKNTDQPPILANPCLWSGQQIRKLGRFCISMAQRTASTTRQNSTTLPFARALTINRDALG